jgi:hypothetical protein
LHGENYSVSPLYKRKEKKAMPDSALTAELAQDAVFSSIVICPEAVYNR